MTTEAQDDSVNEPTHEIAPQPEPEEVPTALIEDDVEPNNAASALLMVTFGVALFLVILLVWTLGSGNRISLFGRNSDTRPTPLAPLLNGTEGSAIQALNASRLGISDVGTFPDGTPRPAVDPLFADYWLANGGVDIFGLPESPLLEDQGRRFQWFQRARLEWWPENMAPFDIQPGRLGLEFTDDREFPRQVYFANRPGLMYEKVTEHGLGEPFLSFWQQHDGLRLFGYPISDEVQEVLPEDGNIHTVQYFERVRLEYHPADEAQPIKIGLLGTALYQLDSKPNIFEPAPQPSAVPILR